MEQNKTDGIHNHNDKFKKNAGREAFQKNEETKFLDDEALENDLTEVPKSNEGDHGQIVDSDRPENQEWSAREKQNRS